MRGNWKKSLPLMIILIFSLVAMVACGSNGGTSGNITSGAESNKENEMAKEITITSFQGGWDVVDPLKDKVGPELFKKLGYKINFEFIKVATNEDIFQKLSLWAATGMNDWPMICGGGWDAAEVALFKRLGEEGKLLDFDTLADKMPDVQKVIKYVAPVIKVALGGLYTMPLNWMDLKSFKVSANLWIRKDWLDKLNLPFPKTVDEFENTLKAFKDNIKLPDGSVVIPFMSAYEGLDLPGYLTNMTMLNFEPAEKFGFDGWAFKDGKAVNLNYEDPQYLIKVLERYNNWYHDGLIDKECFTLKQSQAQEKVNLGRVGCVYGPDYFVTPFTDNLQKSDPNAMFVGTPILYDPAVTNGPDKIMTPISVWCLNTVRSDIPKDQLNTFIDFLNKSVTDDYFLLENFGVKDYHWQLNKDGQVEDTPDCAARLKGDYNARSIEGIQSYLQITNYDLLAKYTAPNTFDKRPDIILSRKNIGTEYYQGYITDPNAYVFPGPVETKMTLGGKDRRVSMIVKAVSGNPDDVEKVVRAWIETEKSFGYNEIAAERTAACKALNLQFPE